MNVIHQLAAEFLEENLDLMESKEFVPRAKQAALEIHSKADRILFLTLVLEGSTKHIEDHRQGCKAPDCGPEGAYRKVSYFLQQELAGLDVVIDHNAFTPDERDAIQDRLDTILNELAQVKEGQGIVAGDVEELKDLMYLGKKKWHRQFTGAVADWVGSGIVSEAVAKPLLDQMGNMLGDLPALPGI